MSNANASKEAQESQLTEKTSVEAAQLKIKSAIEDQIEANGTLSGIESYRIKRASANNKSRKKIPALMPVLDKNGVPALAKAGASQLIVEGDAPKGFGHHFDWDRKQDQLLLVMYINAADQLGLSIGNLKAGDIFYVSSASGIASFSEDHGNPLAGSIVGLIAAGLKVGAGIAGYPGAVPLIEAGDKFAQEQFKATNVKNKKRDAFGEDPGSGHKARQEGGILVCLPDAGKTFYSGNGDHKERWIKEPGDRTDANLPKHVFGAFFPIAGMIGHNTRKVGIDGEAQILAWDWKHEDNAGFYKVFVHIMKGTTPTQPPID